MSPCRCLYTEKALHGVIRPTVMSLKTALSSYETQGRTANIFVNDGGMQLIPGEEAQARRDFYDEHNISRVARPKHSPCPEDSSLSSAAGSSRRPPK